MDKKRGSLKKRPTKKFMIFREKSEGLMSRGNFRDDGDLANQLAATNAVIAGVSLHSDVFVFYLILESGRMMGRQQDKMAVFEQEDFNLDKFSETQLANLTEKGMGNLKNDLSSLQDRCEQEVC